MNATTEKVKLRCPVCGKKLSCTPDKVGRLAKCPHCGDTVRVAAPGLTAPPGVDTEVSYERPPNAPESAPRTYVPQTTLEKADSGLLWKALFLSVAPMALGLGVFIGYVVRPPTPEERVARAREESQEILSEARERAQETVRRAEQQARQLAPPEQGTTGQEAAADMVRARHYLPRISITEQTRGLSALGTPALVGEVQNTGESTVEMVELTLTYRSPAGDVVKSKKNYPVDARDGAIGYTPPLKPGQTTSFVINLDDRPESATGQPRLQVTGVSLVE